jgi:hypothetical protein
MNFSDSYNSNFLNLEFFRNEIKEVQLNRSPEIRSTLDNYVTTINSFAKVSKSRIDEMRSNISISDLGTQKSLIPILQETN